MGMSHACVCVDVSGLYMYFLHFLCRVCACVCVFVINAFKLYHVASQLTSPIPPMYANQDHVIELCSGMCIALELRAEEAVSTFRQTAGPWDVEMAKELRPDTLRGKYGVDRVRNAIHCTDLESDSQAENEYCFKIMDGYTPAQKLLPYTCQVRYGYLDLVWERLESVSTQIRECWSVNKQTKTA